MDKPLAYFVGPTLLFLFLALGIALLLVSRERLVERFSELLFAFTRKSYNEHEVISPRSLVLLSRTGGVIALAIALISARMVLQGFGF